MKIYIIITTMFSALLSFITTQFDVSEKYVEYDLDVCTVTFINDLDNEFEILINNHPLLHNNYSVRYIEQEDGTREYLFKRLDN